MQRLTATLSMVIMLTIGGFVLWTTTADAGRIEPHLEQALSQTAPDQTIPVMIRPVGTTVGSALKKELAHAYAKRSDRHRAAVTTLKSTATTTQRGILSALESAAYQGRVNDVRSFWIDNVITAQMTPTAIAEMANRADVDEIVQLPNVEFFHNMATGSETSATPADATVFDATPGLRAIKADSVWAMGYTGKGRLVATIDTGVDGEHNFLKDKWRGNNGYSLKESWFDPLGNETVPKYFPGDGDAHGTNVMGIIVAVQDSALRNDPDLDTVGVAPDAQWISAAVIDILGANIIEAMQWCADPDGDPNTEYDVPDVVNNSWGAQNAINGCSDVFWNAIDNVEASGAVMLFAAGNEGPGAKSIRNPANRATTDLNAFSVGMIDANNENFPIHPLSSLGPSDCDGVSIKPEVVAPGVAIQTTTPRGFMDQGVLGTSFAVPHVAGGILLMRECNPNLTVDQIKTILLNTARDLGAPGPDNTYGNGLIDLAAAIRAIPPNDQPALYIKKDYYTRPSPGGTTEMVIVLRSAGTTVDNVSVTVTSLDPRLSVVNGLASFGDFAAEGDTAGNFTAAFELAVDESAVQGERLAMRFQFSGSGGYSRTVNGAVQVGPTRDVDMYTHTAGNFTMSVTPYGIFGCHPLSESPRYGGLGYTYGNDATQSMFEGAFLVGTGPDQVSDDARDEDSFPDADFQTDPGGFLDVTEGGPIFAEETRAGFSDANAEHPIGVFIVQRTLVSDDPDEDDYLTIEYTIHNRSGAPLTNLHAGLYFDWDFPWGGGGSDFGGFDATEGVGWMVDEDGTRFRGVTVLTPPGTTSYHYFLNDPEVYSTDGNPENGWDGFTNAEKWAAMSGGFTQTVPTVAQDGSHLIATGPFDLAIGDSVTVAFAVIGALSEEDLIVSAQRARSGYSAGIVNVLPTNATFDAKVNGDNPDDKSVTIVNGTVAPIDYTASNNASWLTVSPPSGSILNGGVATLNLSASITGLEIGQYKDTITIVTSDEETADVMVGVTLNVNAESINPIDPNPFNPNDGPVTLRALFDTGVTPTGGRAAIYDITGEKVRDLKDNEISLGQNIAELTWDGRNDDKIVANGVYFGHVHIDVNNGKAFDKTYTIVLKK